MIQSIIQSHISSLYGETGFTAVLSAPPKLEHGEYCFGVFTLAKPTGKNPAIIAEEVANILRSDKEHFKSVNTIGGYVNITFTTMVWNNILSSILHPSEEKIGSGKTIVVDYIGMNVGKPPHIGHICTPLQGQSVINMMRYFGYTVIGDSHLGDWGSLFGKLIVGYKTYGNEEKLTLDAIDHLLEIYVKINADCEANPDIEQACRDAFRELASGNEEYTTMWATFTRASIITAKHMLQMMHIKQDYDIGESFYEWVKLPRIGEQPALQYDMNSITKELVEKWIAIENEDGSIGVTFPEDSKLSSTILRKRDGTNLYLTSDLAAIKYRLTNGWNPSKILYFVDIRQELHLKQAFWIAKKAWPELTENVEFFHAANGALVLPEGAMSTRKWNIIRLDALVDEGFVRTKKILGEKNRELSESDIREIAIGAIKYSYLSQDRERNVVFTWDKALSFEGNSGPYIQYACVRAQKVAQSTQIDSFDISGSTLSEYDTTLIRTLAMMDEKIMDSANKYKPHTLALYCYDLAVCFNSFYVHTPKILEESDINLKNLRLTLCRLVSEKLTLGFDLLAIKMPSEM